MKKLFFGALVACVAATFVACGNSTPKADLKNDVDTMSYAMGMSQTQGLKEFMVERMGVDTAYMDDFIKGLNDGANAGDDKKKAAYYAGIQIGQQISNQMVKGINHEVFGDDSTKTISLKNFMAGFITGTTGKKGLMTVEQAAQVAQTKMMAIKAKNMEKEYGPNKVAGEKFLAANKKKPGVVTLPSGVQYKVIKDWEKSVSLSPSSSLRMTRPPERLEAVSTESVSLRARSGFMMSRSTTTSMWCFLFLSSAISSVSSYKLPSTRTRA